MSENNEEKNVYKERPDLVEALKGRYFSLFEPSKYADGYEGGSFGEITGISEVVGERMVKLTLRLVVLGTSPRYSAVTAEPVFPWWMSKKHADDELTADMVIDKMNKTQTREEFVEMVRKTLNQSLQVLEEMGITKAELLR